MDIDGQSGRDKRQRETERIRRDEEETDLEGMNRKCERAKLRVAWAGSEQAMSNKIRGKMHTSERKMNGTHSKAKSTRGK